MRIEGDTMLLAGDIGATKSHLAVYRPGARLGEPLAEKTVQSGKYPDLKSMLKEFISQVGQKIEGACFGVAGPVVGGRVTTTNLPWVVDQEHLRCALHLSFVWLLNDLVAISNAVPLLKESDLHILNVGKSQAEGAIAVIAPGTGLGEAFLTWDGSRYGAHASEGGHADFAPTNSLQAELLDYLKNQSELDHVSYERVCSGLGIPNIYAFLRDSSKAQEPDGFSEQLSAADDPTPIIVKAALDKEKICPLCVATLHTFLSILGAEAGNLALKVLATGGVYVGGGIPPRILPALDDGKFMEAFLSKGRLSDLMVNIPVFVILNPKAALLGAAYQGLELWRLEQQQVRPRR
jgi:glucokinase